jgi:hypothetical protein
VKRDVGLQQHRHEAEILDLAAQDPTVEQELR